MKISVSDTTGKVLSNTDTKYFKQPQTADLDYLLTFAPLLYNYNVDVILAIIFWIIAAGGEGDCCGGL